MLKCILVFGLLVMLATASFGAGWLVNLGQGVSLPQLSADGRHCVYAQSGFIKMWNGATYNLGAGSSPGGITLQNGKVVTTARLSTGPGLYVDGTWSPLPLAAGSTATTWAPTCVAATDTEIIVGGWRTQLVGGVSVRQIVRYKASTGTTDLIPVPPDSTDIHTYMNYNSVSENGIFVATQYSGTAPMPWSIAMSANNVCAGTDSGLSQIPYLYGPPSEAGQAWGAGINRTGTLVVGMSELDVGLDYRPVYWDTSDWTCHALPLPNDGSLVDCTQGMAQVVSDDGKVMAGWCWQKGKYKEDFQYPCIWLFKEDGSIEAHDLAAYAASQGINVAGWNLRDVYGISADGMTLSGRGVYGGNNTGWMISFIPEPCSTSALVFGLVWLAIKKRRS